MVLIKTPVVLQFQLRIESKTILTYNIGIDWSRDMKKYQFGDQTYELIENYKDGFEQDAVQTLYTEYFQDYDYIVGDWSYGKLRLKGFYNKNNSKKVTINDFQLKQKYIKENCAYDCKYFVLEKKGSV